MEENSLKKPRSKGTILVVDDNRAMQLLLESMLNRKSYEPYLAASGKEACKLARELHPHLILLDVCLPDLSGYEVCKQLKKDTDTQDIPVVFITGNREKKDLIKGLRMGAIDYIAKPIEEKILLSKVNTLVELSRNTRELKKTHSELLASNLELKRFSQALDNASDAVVMTNNKRNITYFNQAFEQLAEPTSPAQSPTGNIHRYFSDRNIVERLATGALEGVATTAETWLERDSTRIPVLAKCSAILSQTGKPRGLMFLITDQTQLREAEAARTRLEAELYHAQKLESVGQLAAGIAHEINTPVQFVGDNIRFMQNSVADLLDLQKAQVKLLEACRKSNVAPAMVETVEKAMADADMEYLEQELPLAISQSLEGVERVASIVRAMKEFAHPGSVSKTPANLNEAIQTTITVARNKWKYVAEMETRFDEALPLVPCLVGEFNQVILNLIVNASDAIGDKVGNSGQRGKIVVSTQCRGNCAEVRIKDTGGGIPDSIKGKLFDPFFTTKEVGQGSGQGLAIARGVIVNKHHGKLTYETTEGEGTTFIIQLPIQTEETEPEGNGQRTTS